MASFCHDSAADSAYAISDVVMVPYRQAETVGDPSKRRFNRRFSGMRTEMIGKTKKDMRGGGHEKLNKGNSNFHNYISLEPIFYIFQNA